MFKVHFHSYITKNDETKTSKWIKTWTGLNYEFQLIVNQVAELTGHDERILHLAMSPGETAVMSAGADETLRLWNCFQPDPNKKKGTTGRRNEPRSALDALSNFR